MRAATSNKSPTSLDAAIGAKVRSQRSILGMSQTELANSLGVTFQQVQKYEKGVNRIGSGRLQEVAHALKVPVTFFYDGISTAGEKGLNATLDLVRTQQGGRVLKALGSIEDTVLRRSLADLIEKVAEATSDYQKRRMPSRRKRQ